MSAPQYRRVSPCEHGVHHEIRHIQDGSNFWVPGCNNGDGKGYMKPHYAGEKYPLGELPSAPRKQRSDKGQKRGARKTA